MKALYHFFALGETTWVTSEGATQLAGWNNVFNGIAGIINIFCMTGWWSVYASEDKTDMLWPDMTWVYIIASRRQDRHADTSEPTTGTSATHNCLPTHSWFCGFALLLAPTVAAFLSGTRAAGSKTALHACHLVHVRAGIPLLPGAVHLCDAPTLDPNAALVVSILAQQTSPRLSTLSIAQEARPQPLQAGCLEGTRDWEIATARRAKVDYAHMD